MHWVWLFIQFWNLHPLTFPNNDYEQAVTPTVWGSSDTLATQTEKPYIFICASIVEEKGFCCVLKPARFFFFICLGACSHTGRIPKHNVLRNWLEKNERQGQLITDTGKGEHKADYSRSNLSQHYFLGSHSGGRNSQSSVEFCWTRLDQDLKKRLHIHYTGRGTCLVLFYSRGITL